MTWLGTILVWIGGIIIGTTLCSRFHNKPPQEPITIEQPSKLDTLEIIHTYCKDKK